MSAQKVPVLQLLDPSDGNAVVESFPLSDKPIMIGRDDACHIPLVDEQVSSHHCKIEYLGQKYHLIDLQSRNGTRVNGQKILKGALKQGDVISVGSVLLRFNMVDAESLAPPKPAAAPRHGDPMPFGSLPPLSAFGENFGASSPSPALPAFQFGSSPAPKGGTVLADIGALSGTGVGATTTEVPSPPDVQEFLDLLRQERQDMLSRAVIQMELRYGDSTMDLIKFMEKEVILGRQTGLPKLEADEEMSRRHAVVNMRSDGIIEVRDNRSTNGTFVNGVRLTEPKVISRWDVVKIGRTHIRVWPSLK